MKRSMAVALGAWSLACAASAFAGPVAREFGPDLVANGSFESGTSVAGSGWAATGFAGEGFDYLIDTDPAHAQSGVRSFAGGGIGAPGFLTQTLATRAGTAYNIHFWIANFSGFLDGTQVQVLWNGAVVYSAFDVPGGGYREIVVDPIATGPTSTLSFGLRDDSFLLNLDNISVRAVPEPATLALALGALVAAASPLTTDHRGARSTRAPRIA